MKLNKNSISARLYRWFYMSEDLPTNLCPYFWQLVVMYLFIIPYSIISSFGLIAKLFDYQAKSSRERFTGGVLGVILVMAASSLFFPVASAFTTIYQGTFYFFLYAFGWCMYILAFAILAAYTYDHIHTKRMEKQHDENRRRIYKEKKPNIIVEFTKAKYNKYCPKIDWNDTEKTI